MRSRSVLHRTKLDGFREHAEREGWIVENSIGAFEVFRAWKMKNGKKCWAFVYDRHSGDHFTVHGNALGIAMRFVHRDELREGQP